MSHRIWLPRSAAAFPNTRCPGSLATWPFGSAVNSPQSSSAPGAPQEAMRPGELVLRPLRSRQVDPKHGHSRQLICAPPSALSSSPPRHRIHCAVVPRPKHSDHCHLAETVRQTASPEVERVELGPGKHSSAAASSLSPAASGAEDWASSPAGRRRRSLNPRPSSSNRAAETLNRDSTNRIPKLCFPPPQIQALHILHPSRRDHATVWRASKPLWQAVHHAAQCPPLRH
mmetsp:Transcript_77158/g.157093  ORF Transcript_77158/g.157093 Transcript_77158/m.157093 type:complete len:229 (-) Transcript_77158:256-942(-)